MIFDKKIYFYFSRLISQELIVASFFIIKAILNPFCIYLPCKVCREYFSIIFNVKKCALYSIKYGNFPIIMFENASTNPAMISNIFSRNSFS